MKKTLPILFLIFLILPLVAERLFAQSIPKVSIAVEQAQGKEDFVTTLQIVFFMTILSLAPSILVMMTSFTRLIVVFSFLRQAMGTHQMPPNQLLVGLCLFLTLFIMKPVINEVHDNALRPYLDDKITQSEAFDNALVPIRQFMLKSTREQDLKTFMSLAQEKKPASADDVPTYILIPSFITSELRTAFQIGFLLYVPFLMVDMIIASVLMSMGMMMLPPILVSMPFKILLFVLVDGWNLVVSSMV